MNRGMLQGRHVVTAVAATGALAIALTIAGVATAGTTGHQAAPGRGTGTLDPADFTHPQANDYFPLHVGHVVTYRGSDDGQRYRERVAITPRHKTIEGIRAHVSRDVLRRVDGSIAEKTFDWYAADNTGNVWYLGEDTATYDREGHLRSRAGSWEAGVDGAEAGLIMPANPGPTDAYRQEYRRGRAEDQAWIVQRNDTVRTPYGRIRHVVRTYEWSRLEPNVLSLKLYGAGIGIVAERDVKGGTERFSVVSVKHG